MTPAAASMPRESPIADLARVMALEHSDPHRVLGMHLSGEGAVVVRAYRPDAEAITVQSDDGGSWPLEPLGRGLFAGEIRRALFPYRLEVRYPAGRTFTFRDPYAFLPTLGELDLYFAGEGRHDQLSDSLGAHPRLHAGTAGTAFAVWAPTARGVSVVGDFDSWDGRLHAMRRMGNSGIWELFVPEVGDGARYKFEVRPGSGGPPALKSDPFAFRAEMPPGTASVVHDLGRYVWRDAAWVDRRAAAKALEEPLSIYEVHLGSWRHAVEDGGHRPLTYRELAPMLADYVRRMGFTHVELLPVAEHPFGGSWGYQVGAYYAPTARYGHPDDFRYLVDHLHQQGIGVLVDWVPGHFPRDLAGLGRFDGTALYEHADPRQGEQPDWGTYVFNFGRNEVRNFLIANARFWIEQYHVDGLRVDAVASMLYLDYSRKTGEWVPNRHGGRENEEAIAFLRELNEAVSSRHPGVLVVAEESTAWPKVSHPVRDGGLGFELKWNMGWMHDTLKYFGTDPLFRVHAHHALTFGLLYAYSEHFVLPLSHDEVVHGKGSLYGRMPGSPEMKLAQLRALFAWMWAHPGRKLLFMGGELGQPAEWNHDRSLDWHLLESPGHAGVQALVADVNRLYRAVPALHALDDAPAGFQWIQADAASTNTYGFVRRARAGRHLICVANLAAAPWSGYRIGFPLVGTYTEVLNTNAAQYGGSGGGKLGPVQAEPKPWDGQSASAELHLPPLSVLWFLSPEV